MVQRLTAHLHLYRPMKERYLFLDFDGVLNTSSYQQYLREKGEKTSDGFGPLFDPAAVQALGKILEAVQDAVIVIISSWKDIHSFVGIREMWIERDLPGSVYAVTPSTMNDDLLVANLADPESFRQVEGSTKGKEIAVWMAGHDALEEPFVIIDDNDRFLPWQREHVVKTNPEVGLTAADAEKAIRLLK